MDMSNSVSLPAPQAQVWTALNDPDILKQCIAGCESLEKSGENAYQVAMTVAIGPVKARFKGNLRLNDIEPPTAYTLQFDGQGGVAGFGKGTARVRLAPDGSGTRLEYTVNAQIGGKIAQLGSRLVDGASKKMADDFFEKFRAVLAALSPVPAEAAPPVIAPAAPAPAMRWWPWAAVAVVVVVALWYFFARR